MRPKETKLSKQGFSVFGMPKKNKKDIQTVGDF